MSVFKGSFKLPYSNVFTDTIGRKKHSANNDFSIFKAISSPFNCGKPYYVTVVIADDCNGGTGSVTYSVPVAMNSNMHLIDAVTGEVLWETHDPGFYSGNGSIEFPFDFYHWAGKQVQLRYNVGGNVFSSNIITALECPILTWSLLPVGACNEGDHVISAQVGFEKMSIVDERKYVMEYYDGLTWVAINTVTNLGNSGTISFNFVNNGLAGQSVQIRVRVLDMDDNELAILTETLADFPVC